MPDATALTRLPDTEIAALLELADRAGLLVVYDGNEAEGLRALAAMVEVDPDLNAELAAETQPWATRARGLTILDSEDRLAAGEALKQVRALTKRVETTFKPYKKGADALKAIVLEQEREHLKTLKAADTAIVSKMSAYDRAVEAQRREEEQARASAQQEAIAAAAAAAQPGQVPAPAPPAPVEASTPKTDGVSKRVPLYEADVVNLRVLVAGVHGAGVPLDALTASQTWLNQQAREHMSAGGTVEEFERYFPGVTVREKDSYRTR